MKAAVRDSKAYIASKGYRTIGVGYATNDDAEIRAAMAAYFNCGNRADSIDFWGYNIYSWCGDSSFRESGFDVRTKEFASYSVPVFFAEYGCNTVQPRLWTDTLSLYSTDMTGVWSGGIVYMYFQETNNYGKSTPPSHHPYPTTPTYPLLPLAPPWVQRRPDPLLTRSLLNRPCHHQR